MRGGGGPGIRSWSWVSPRVGVWAKWDFRGRADSGEKMHPSGGRREATRSHDSRLLADYGFLKAFARRAARLGKSAATGSQESGQTGGVETGPWAQNIGGETTYPRPITWCERRRERPLSTAQSLNTAATIATPKSRRRASPCPSGTCAGTLPGNPPSPVAIFANSTLPRIKERNFISHPRLNLRLDFSPTPVFLPNRAK
jgi:hypothetical protein